MEGLIVHRKPASPEVLATRRARIAELSAAFFKVPQLDHGRSVQEIREMRVNGTHGFPKPWYYEGAKTIDAPSRGTHKVPLRIINPTNARRGFALHYHSGSFMSALWGFHRRLRRRDRWIRDQFSQLPRSLFGRHRQTPGHDGHQR